jgi:hypothetical protein
MSITNNTIESVLNPQSSENGRIRQSIENWKRKLLDLSKRNRALNFRMNKVSTIAIVDEQPAEIFRMLYLQEQAMRFKAAPEAKEQLELKSDSAVLKEPGPPDYQTPAEEGDGVG